MQLRVGEQSVTLKVWGQHSEPDLDVMDNPSSVITQVSRDEEGNKAAGERGELSLFLSRLGSCQKKTTKKKKLCTILNSENTHTYTHTNLLYWINTVKSAAQNTTVGKVDWSYNTKTVTVSLFCIVYGCGPLACDESEGSDVVMFD